jgi:hypothetical protein
LPAPWGLVTRSSPSSASRASEPPSFALLKEVPWVPETLHMALRQALLSWPQSGPITMRSGHREPGPKRVREAE